MFKVPRIIRKLFRNRIDKQSSYEIAPDEIFLDSSNLPQFDRTQFEGRMEKPIQKKSLILLGCFFMLIAILFGGKLWMLQVREGEAFSIRSENNRLNHTPIFSDRGVIEDRNGIKLAWNEPNPDTPDFSLRKYIDKNGFSNVIGFVKYPSKDTSGFYFRENFEGIEGVERFYDDELGGIHGLKIVETNAQGMLQSQSTIEPPTAGKDLELSIDSRLQEQFYIEIDKLAQSVDFKGGAAFIMDVRTGEVIVDVSYPEFDSNIMTDGSDRDAIVGYSEDTRNPFLKRTISGLYTPGSIVKPFVAIGALNEGIIDPYKSIRSTGSITIPNPYFPDRPTVFRDWKAHGWTDMRQALSVSSDVYFYAIGGGYEDQKGMGITMIDKYLAMFGFGQNIHSPFYESKKGTIPTPEWKKATFDGEEWTLGNTYHTAIGQYGFQVTPVQVVRAVATIANEGRVVEPTVLKSDKPAQPSDVLSIDSVHYRVIKEGMRMGVNGGGTAGSLNVPYVKVAAKTGTAELGISKSRVNSWVTGFFPFDNPQYAFAVLMEEGPVTNLVGASYVMRQVLDWVSIHAPEYYEE